MLDCLLVLCTPTHLICNSSGGMNTTTNANDTTFDEQNNIFAWHMRRVAPRSADTKTTRRFTLCRSEDNYACLTKMCVTESNILIAKLQILLVSGKYLGPTSIIFENLNICAR
jgi:hypothetical protein